MVYVVSLSVHPSVDTETDGLIFGRLIPHVRKSEDGRTMLFDCTVNDREFWNRDFREESLVFFVVYCRQYNPPDADKKRDSKLGVAPIFRVCIVVPTFVIIFVYPIFVGRPSILAPRPSVPAPDIRARRECWGRERRWVSNPVPRC